MDMQPEHAESTCRMDKQQMGMQHSHAEWKCRMDMENGHAAKTCSMDVHYGMRHTVDKMHGQEVHAA
jgi:hypothetical protein